jgi:hypothetical protein
MLQRRVIWNGTSQGEHRSRGDSKAIGRLARFSNELYLCRGALYIVSGSDEKEISVKTHELGFRPDGLCFAVDGTYTSFGSGFGLEDIDLGRDRCWFPTRHDEMGMLTALFVCFVVRKA